MELKILRRVPVFEMNPLPDINFNMPSTIQLTIPQLTSIFDQLRLFDAKFSPYTKVSIQLEPFQIPSNTIAIPITKFNSQPLNVESYMQSFIKPNKINKTVLAKQLNITEKELMQLIQNSDIDELTQTFNKLLNEKFTTNDIMVLIRNY